MSSSATGGGWGWCLLLPGPLAVWAQSCCTCTGPGPRQRGGGAGVCDQSPLRPQRLVCPLPAMGSQGGPGRGVLLAPAPGGPPGRGLRSPRPRLMARTSGKVCLGVGQGDGLRATRVGVGLGRRRGRSAGLVRAGLSHEVLSQRREGPTGVVTDHCGPLGAVGGQGILWDGVAPEEEGRALHSECASAVPAPQGGPGDGVWGSGALPAGAGHNQSGQTRARSPSSLSLRGVCSPLAQTWGSGVLAPCKGKGQICIPPALSAGFGAVPSGLAPGSRCGMGAAWAVSG